MITAALFDYDGTLANTDAVHHTCWNRALMRFGASLDRSFYSTHCSGALSLHIAGQILRTNPEIDLSAQALADEKDAHYEASMAAETIAVMPGVHEMLEFLKQRNVRTGIVTGAPLAAITKTLIDNGLSESFEIKVTREDVAQGKPAPDGYLLGLKRIGCAARASLSFEDTRSGVLAAKAAGMTGIAIPNPYTASHDFSAADHVCADLHEAKALLGRMSF